MKSNLLLALLVTAGLALTSSNLVLADDTSTLRDGQSSDSSGDQK